MQHKMCLTEFIYGIINKVNIEIMIFLFNKIIKSITENVDFEGIYTISQIFD